MPLHIEQARQAAAADPAASFTAAWAMRENSPNPMHRRMQSCCSARCTT